MDKDKNRQRVVTLARETFEDGPMSTVTNEVVSADFVLHKVFSKRPLFTLCGRPARKMNEEGFTRSCGDCRAMMKLARQVRGDMGTARKRSEKIAASVEAGRQSAQEISDERLIDTMQKRARSAERDDNIDLYVALSSAVIELKKEIGDDN